MRPLPTLLLVLLAATPAYAQEATPAAPEIELLETTVWGSLAAPPKPIQDGTDAATLDAVSRFQEAGVLLHEGRPVEAARIYEDLAQHPGWPEARYGAALSRLAAGHVGAAREHAALAAQGRPEDPVFLYLAAVLQHATGRHEDAATTMAGAVERARAQGSRSLLALGQLNLGNSLRMLGRPDEARTRYREARLTAEAIGDKELQAEAWMGEGFAASWVGDWKAANAAWNQATVLAGPQPKKASYAESTAARARRALDEGNRDEAGRRVDQATVELNRIVSPVERAEILLTIADLEAGLGRASAPAHLEESRLAFQQAGLQLQQARVLRTRAGWALDRGDATAAANDAEGAVGIEEGLQAPVALAQSRLLLAQIRGAQGRAKDALPLAQKALDTFSRTRSLVGEVHALRILSDLSEKADDAPQAKTWAKKARDRAKAGGDTLLWVEASTELAELLATQGDPDGAGKELAALPAAELQKGPIRIRFRPQYERVRALVGAKRGADALPIARSLWDSVKALPDAEKEWKELARGALVECLLATGKEDEATRFIAEQGGDERLRNAVSDARSNADHNAAIDAYNRNDWEGAAKRWETMGAQSDLSTERKQAASVGLLGTVLQLGQQHEDAGRLAEAQARYGQARDLGRTLREVASEVRALLGLARVRGTLEDAREAQAYAAQAATLAQGQPDQGLLAEAWNTLGEQLGEGDAAAAVDAFDRALLAWGVGPQALDGKASATYNAAVLELRLGRKDAARARASSARDLATRAGRKDVANAAAKLLLELGS